MYARFSCSADQFSRMMKYERIAIVGKKMKPQSLPKEVEEELGPLVSDP